MVPRLGPWVGEQDEHPVHRGVRQGGQELASIAGMDADVARAEALDVAQGAGHAIDEGLGPQHQRLRMRLGLGRHVLAPAEPQLDPDVRRFRHEPPRLERLTHIQPKPRQQRIQQRRPPLPQHAPFHPAIGAQRFQG